MLFHFTVCFPHRIKPGCLIRLLRIHFLKLLFFLFLFLFRASLPELVLLYLPTHCTLDGRSSTFVNSGQVNKIISHVKHHLWFGKKYWNKSLGNLLRLYFTQKNIDFNLITIFHGVLISAKCSKFS